MTGLRWKQTGWPVLIGAYSAGAALAGDWVTTLSLTAPVAVIPSMLWLLSGAGHWITAFLVAAMLLPPLPIAGGNAGPHPCAVFAAFGIAAGLLRFREWRFWRNAVAQWLLLFLLVLAFSVGCAAFYSGLDGALGSLARVMLFGISAYVYLYTAHGPGIALRESAFARMKTIFFAAAIAAAFACADFYFQFPAPAGYGPQFVWLDTGVFRRAQGLFYEASTLGNFCAFFLLGIAAAAWQPARARLASWPVLFVTGALFGAALILSYSRASVINLVVSLGVLFFLHRQKIPLRRIALGLVSASAVAIGAVYLLFPEFARTYTTRFLLSWQNLFSETNLVLSHRPENWGDLWTFLSGQPWVAILGVGYKTLPYSDVAGRPLIVDNMYMSLLAETGIFGLLVFLGLSAAILRSARCAARSGDARAAFFGTWIFCFWIGELVQMLSGDLLTYWRTLPIYLWVLALAGSGRSDEDSVSRPVR